MNELLRRKGDVLCDRLRGIAPDAVRIWRGKRLLSGSALIDAVAAMQHRLDALLSEYHAPNNTNPTNPNANQ